LHFENPSLQFELNNGSGDCTGYFMVPGNDPATGGFFNLGAVDLLPGETRLSIGQVF
jgi:hypothetical protein